MILYRFTLMGVAAVIAAIASLFTAVGQVWNNRKLARVGDDVRVVKNGNGKEPHDEGPDIRA